MPQKTARSTCCCFLLAEKINKNKNKKRQQAVFRGFSLCSFFWDLQAKETQSLFSKTITYKWSKRALN